MAEVREAVETAQFGRFTLDAHRRLLLADGVPVQLHAKAFDLLVFLVTHCGEALSREAILAHVWEGKTVADSNLSVQLSALRAALKKAGSTAEMIVTLPGPRYRFVGPVESPAEPRAPQPRIAEPEPAPPVPAPARAVRPKRRRAWALAASVALIIATSLAWRTLRPGAVGPAPQRFSIAVLPFRNLSVDRSQDYLADAITDDLTTDLAHLPASTVIARESADQFRDRRLPVQQIGSALQVRYLLEGSLRAEGQSYHINAALIDASTGTQLWAERFDTGWDHLGSARDAIVRRIASGLDLQWDRVETARSVKERPDDPDATDLFFRARAILDTDDTIPALTEAASLLEKSVAKEPDFADALAELGWVRLRRVMAVGDAAPAADRQQAHEAISRALALEPENATARAARAHELLLGGDCQAAQFAALDALSHSPSSVEPRLILADCAWLRAKLDDEDAQLEEILRINPDGRDSAHLTLMRGSIRLLQGRAAEAAELINRAIAGDPDPQPGAPSMGRAEYARILLIAAADMQGNRKQAMAELAAYAKIWPNRSVWRFANYYPRDVAALPGAARVLAALRDAGMPEYGDATAALPAGDTTCTDGEWGVTPSSLPGGTVIGTQALAAALASNAPPLVVDLGRGSAAVPGGHWFSPETAATMSMRAFIAGVASSGQAHAGSPAIVIMGDGPFGCDSFTAAAGLVAQGHAGVAWYRDGEEGWSRSGHAHGDVRRAW
jgi:TolB-like protein/DNA-binding winged helix-turn-helix (wHTH) protein